MIFLLPVFIIVILISFWLARSSMKDYKEGVKNYKNEYGLFLVRNSVALNHECLSLIRAKIVLTDDFFSLERLLKGQESALVIFGPKGVLAGFVPTLNLIELEDFTVSVSKANLSVAELGVKAGNGVGLDFTSIFDEIESLSNEEQIWTQVVMKADKNSQNLTALIRIAVLSYDQVRRNKIMGSIIKTPFVKIPRPYSVERMVKFYQDRTFSLDRYLLKLSGINVLKLLSIQRR